MSDKARLPYVGVDDANEATRPLPRRRPAAGPPTGPTSGLPLLRPAAAGPSDSVWPASEPAAPGQPDSVWPVPGTSAAVPSDSVWPDPEAGCAAEWPVAATARCRPARPRRPAAPTARRRPASPPPASCRDGLPPARRKSLPPASCRNGPPPARKNLRPASSPGAPRTSAAGRHRSPHRLTLPTDAPPLVLAVGGFACQASDDIAAEIVSAVEASCPNATIRVGYLDGSVRTLTEILTTAGQDGTWPTLPPSSCRC